MPVSTSVADWILRVGEDRVKVGVTDRFVKQFLSWSKPFRYLMRDPTIQSTRQIPLPKLSRFTSVHEYFICEGVYSDDPHQYHTYAPIKTDFGPYMGKTPPQHSHEIALEKSQINLMMYEFGCLFDIDELRDVALNKLGRHVRPAWRHPDFVGLVVAADSLPDKEAQRVLRRTVRQARADADFTYEEFEQMKSDFRRLVRHLKAARSPDWESDEQTLTEFVVDVEYNAGSKSKSKSKSKSRQSLLRGNPFW